MTESSGSSKKIVHYQSITFSDEEGEESDNHAEAVKADANPEGMYTNLRTLDDLCEGVVTETDADNERLDNEMEHRDGPNLRTLDDLCEGVVTETDADNERLDNELQHREGPGYGLPARDNEEFGAEEAGENLVMVEVAVYTCKLCGGSFKQQNEVEAHLLVEHDLGEQTSLFRVLKSVKRKKKKAWRKEKDGYVHCQYCHHRSRRSINVREHEKEKHANEELPQKLYECKLCKNRFALEQIFSHIQTEHESEADHDFIGNSLTEHYTVSFSTESKKVIPEGSSELDHEQEVREMPVSFSRYNHCSKCAYKSKSVRGLKAHERMKHPTMKKSDEMTCTTCGQKRLKNAVHTCKVSNGKRRQLYRNEEGHFVCKDCNFTAKLYHSMYIHTKENRHQAVRTTTARPVKRKPIREAVDENLMQDTSRVLRQRTSKKNGNPDLLEESPSETNDFSDSAQVVPIHTDDITEATVEGNTVDASKTDMQADWPSGVEGLIDSDDPGSGLDDSDLDPEWAPTATPSQPKIKRGPGRPRKDAGYGSESDSDSEASNRKRRASNDSGGHSDKRRRYMEVPKDPNSEPPKKLANGNFKCNFCDFESKYFQSTEVHQWRHTGYKPYKCDICPSAFRSRAMLDKHVCVAISADTDKPETPVTDAPDKPTDMPDLDQSSPSKANTDTEDVPAASENTEVTKNLDTSPVTENAQTESNQSPNPASNEDNTAEMAQDKGDPAVTSPTPIVIAPPLGTHVGNLQVTDSGTRAVPHLDGNGDSPELCSPQGMQNAGPRMTSPVGIPLNIAPISSMGGVDPTRQMSMSMGGMGEFPDGSQYGMGNPPPIMDMPMGPSSDMMSGMMGVRGSGMPGDGIMHPGQYPSGYQQMNTGPNQHEMNPMGGMMNPGDVPFSAPSMNLMDNLNIMPNNNMMTGSSGGFATPPSQLSTQRHPSLEQTGSNMMSMDNNNFMIDLNTSESQGRFDINQPMSTANMDMNMQAVTVGSTASDCNVLPPPASTPSSQQLPPSASPLQQTAMSEPTTPTTVRVTPEQTAFSIASSPMSLINQASDSESMASVSVLAGTPNAVLPSDHDVATGSTSDKSEATAVDNNTAQQGNDSDRPDAPATTAETPQVSSSVTSWSLTAGTVTLGTDMLTGTTSTATVPSTGTTLAPSASDITAAALMAISASAPVSESTQPIISTQPVTASQPVPATTASSTSTPVITAVTGTIPTPVTQPSTPTKPVTNESGKTINDLYKCLLCRVYFEDQHMHRNHMAQHGKQVGTCGLCNKMFRTPLLFMNHLHCPAGNCQGLQVNSMTSQFTASPRARGRGTRGGISPAITNPRLPQGYPQIQQGSVRGSRGRAAPQRMTMPMTAVSQPRMASPRGGPLQAMRQMTPTAGRRGRPPLGVNRSVPAYNTAAMQQPLQQRQFSAHLQQMGAMRPAASPVRQPTPRRRPQQPISDDVIVID